MKKNGQTVPAKPPAFSGSRKKPDKKSRGQEHLFAAFVEQSSDMILLVNRDKAIVLANNQAEKSLGVKKDDLVGSSIFHYAHPDDFKNVTEILETGVPDTCSRDHITEIRLSFQDGTWHTLQAAASRCPSDHDTDTVWLHLRDITDFKKTQKELEESDALYRLLAENITEHIWIMDLNLNLTYISPSVEKIYGYPLAEIRKLKLKELLTKESIKIITEALSAELSRAMINPPPPPGTRRIMELQARHKDGHLLWIENRLSFIRNQHGKPVSIMGETRDITERKLYEEKLRDSEAKYRTILEDIKEGYFETDLAGNFTFFNDTVSRVMGYPREELMGMNNRQYTDEEDLRHVFQAYNQVYETGEPQKDLIWKIRRKDGGKRHIEASISLLKDASGIPTGFRGIAHDITERKQAERILKESEEKYRLLADHMKDQVWIMDMNMKITYISPSVERLMGYSLDEIKKMSWDQLLTPDSLKKATDFITVQMPKALKASPDYLLFKTLELEFILKNGQIVWGECAFSFIRDTSGRVLSILGEARNITERKIAEEKLQQTLESLKRATGTTIQVLVSALEVRDPYTAGHQSRTAHLACAIAMHMGLDHDKIEGIMMAGTIHDIGKLSIPAEILTKPGKLTNIEFSLIKEHPQSGYDMLKDVESPWPLAEIVRQHHERINGTGYPKNLKGEEILIEARILAVADVVEAMGSHRPYRPSLGIEVALQEIEKNKGILYDTMVADACLNLFRNKGFAL